MSVQQLYTAFNQINQELTRSDLLNRIEKQTNISRQYLVTGFGAFYFFLIFLNFGGIGQVLANFAAVALPGYYSLIAIETPGKADDTQFLTYWVVYAFFSVIEFWSGIILYWIPFYWFLKSIAFLYLGLPHFGGAEKVYQLVVRPFSLNVLKIRQSQAQNLKDTFSGSGSSTGASL